MAIILTQIHIYPVKSLKGIMLESATVEHRGLQYDRRWMVVNADGQFVTQRELPRMALITPAIEKGILTLTAPDMPPISVPLEMPPGLPTVLVRVWRSECQACDAGDEARAWLSDYLKTRCRLVYMPQATRREVDSKYRAGEGIVSFADGFPLLLTGQASLDDLNSRLQKPVPMDRFRPNIVVSGALPYAEDRWKLARIGEIGFHFVKPCARCVITTIDQATGEPQGGEPLRTLSTYRLRDQGALFGQNLVPAEHGELKVGDTVRVLQEQD